METCAFAIAPRAPQSRLRMPRLVRRAPAACSATCPTRLDLITVLLLLALACHAHAQTTAAASHADRLKVFKGNGISLHYLDRGIGVPVVFVHGALDDYRIWQDQIAPFSRGHRVIAYSRRYNY